MPAAGRLSAAPHVRCRCYNAKNHNFGIVRLREARWPEAATPVCAAPPPEQANTKYFRIVEAPSGTWAEGGQVNGKRPFRSVDASRRSKWATGTMGDCSSKWFTTRAPPASPRLN